MSSRRPPSNRAPSRTSSVDESRSFNRTPGRSSKRGSSAGSSLGVFGDGFGERSSPAAPVTRPEPRRQSSRTSPDAPRRSSSRLSPSSSGRVSPDRLSSSRGSSSSTERRRSSSRPTDPRPSRSGDPRTSQRPPGRTPSSSQRPKDPLSPSSSQRPKDPRSPSSSQRLKDPLASSSQRPKDPLSPTSQRPKDPLSPTSQRPQDPRSSSRPSGQSSTRPPRSTSPPSASLRPSDSQTRPARSGADPTSPKVAAPKPSASGPPLRDSLNFSASSFGPSVMPPPTPPAAKPAEAQAAPAPSRLPPVATSPTVSPISDPLSAPTLRDPTSPSQPPRALRDDDITSNTSDRPRRSTSSVYAAALTNTQRAGSRLMDDSAVAPSRLSFSGSMSPAPVPRSHSLADDWLEDASLLTTTTGLCELETHARRKILHAGIFRPQLWYHNNILPLLRHADIRQNGHIKRCAFIEMSEPNFRVRIQRGFRDSLMRLRLEHEEGRERVDLIKATNLWRTQVKHAFDRLLDQLYVEHMRKQDEVRTTALSDAVRAVKAQADKTSFSYTHMHIMFGEFLLRRAKETYVFYFGVLSSTTVKETHERIDAVFDEGAERLIIEADRMRYFLRRMEAAEFDHMTRFFHSERRALDKELRFRPRRGGPLPSIAQRSSVGGTTSMAPSQHSPPQHRTGGSVAPYIPPHSQPPSVAVPSSLPAREAHGASPLHGGDRFKEAPSPLSWVRGGPPTSPPERGAHPDRGAPSSGMERDPHETTTRQLSSEMSAMAIPRARQMPKPDAPAFPLQALESQLLRRWTEAPRPAAASSDLFLSPAAIAELRSPSVPSNALTRHSMIGEEQRRTRDDVDEVVPMGGPQQQRDAPQEEEPRRLVDEYLPLHESSVRPATPQVSRAVHDGVVSGIRKVLAVGERLPPVTPAPSDGHEAVNFRGLLGIVPSSDRKSRSVPEQLDQRTRTQAAEQDTAIALLLLLHRDGADKVAEREFSERDELREAHRHLLHATAVSVATLRFDALCAARRQGLCDDELDDRMTIGDEQRTIFSQMQQLEARSYAAAQVAADEMQRSQHYLARRAIDTNHARDILLAASRNAILTVGDSALKLLKIHERVVFEEGRYAFSFVKNVFLAERRDRRAVHVAMDKDRRAVQRIVDARILKATLRSTPATEPSSSPQPLRGSPSRATPWPQSTPSPAPTVPPSKAEFFRKVSIMGRVLLEEVEEREEVERRTIMRTEYRRRNFVDVQSEEEPLARQALEGEHARWQHDTSQLQRRLRFEAHERASRRTLFESWTHMIATQFLATTHEVFMYDTWVEEQRTRRSLAMDYAKEQRQRQLRMRESEDKRAAMASYLSHALIAQNKRQLMHNAFLKFRAEDGSADGTAAHLSSLEHR